MRKNKEGRKVRRRRQRNEVRQKMWKEEKINEETLREGSEEDKEIKTVKTDCWNIHPCCFNYQHGLRRRNGEESVNILEGSNRGLIKNITLFFTSGE